MVDELALPQEQTGRTDAQQVALDLANAMITSPGTIDGELRERLHAQYSAEQIVELALDTMKWSYQKVAVALRTDVEIVPGELTDLVFDDDGNWVRQ